MRSSWRCRNKTRSESISFLQIPKNHCRQSASAFKPIMQGFRHQPEILQDVPEQLTQSLKQYEDWFIVDGDKLKEITAHFVDELAKGLSIEGGSIVRTMWTGTPMNVTWVSKLPNGHEKGHILTVDMGETNVRVCEVSLGVGKREFEQIQRKYKLPDDAETCTKETLWDFIAEKLASFLEDPHAGRMSSKPLPMACTFSFPVDQRSIRSGILQRWTKNFNVPGVEANDVVPQLEAALKRKNVPLKVVALINDTTGTLVAPHYRAPQLTIGSIFSTGCNAAYMEECRFIPKLRGSGLPEDASVIINTEYGAFDERQNALEASFLSIAETDISDELIDLKEEFQGNLKLQPTLGELKSCRYLIGLIATRAARLYACGIAAICKKKNTRQCHVGINGSVFNKYSMFKGRASQALREILDWPPGGVELVALNAAEDGRGSSSG
ncbi:uncharacterized protein N7446_013873 [Penicillium canescens]|uniref:Phosphotransferase n=1 Tax=Penicillium canescens TaxID=5083 RepID=A0AAD6HZQ6_PENCN|nr:uncharacterized protein N7446_013873 [Penicillium canescens]KAJ6023508.1 hypothetical protein N7460_013903 [Penicillium canescens]KAJ6042807.1 hypothetical protein N7446_013873 [Penicillium canescens]